MTVLELSFPAGRYHATPWSRHVNEGAVEWPPSPWRIVRALMATWYLKAREIPEETVRLLVNAISQPPGFQLPQATTSHTRHYMPYNEGKNEKTTKIFDTFIQLPENARILVAWNIALSATELDALRILASRLGYFGRAESLVTARVLDGVTAIEANALPMFDKDKAEPPAGHETVRLLCPMSLADYEQWRENFIANHTPPTDGKKKPSKKAKAPEIPADLFAALHAETGELQNAGWNLPPGAKFINYARNEDAFAPTLKPRSRRKGAHPTVARYTVVSAVPPRITQTVSITDRVHQALCKKSDQGKGRAQVFTGLDGEGKPLADHRHAHIFCEANGPCDAITHITIWAEMGFDENDCLALRRLNKVWGHGGHDIRLVLHGIGQPKDFKDCALFRSARVWRSLTPYVSTRHTKAFRDGRPKMDPANGWQVGSAGHDLLRLLSLNPTTAEGVIRQTKGISINERTVRCLQFQIIRHGGGGRHGAMEGESFAIEFPEKITGPLAFGYGSHFGLGLFVPHP